MNCDSKKKCTVCGCLIDTDRQKTKPVYQNDLPLVYLSIGSFVTLGFLYARVCRYIQNDTNKSQQCLNSNGYLAPTNKEGNDYYSSK